MLDQHLFDLWSKKGVEFLHIIPIDNPFAEPFDVSLMGTMNRKQADVGIKAIKRNTLRDKVGVLIEENEKVLVKDYTDMPEEVINAKDRHGQLKYLLGNTGQYCFRLSFLKKLSEKNIHLPLHWVKKELSVGKRSISVWKAEKFALDLLQYSPHSVAVCYPKETSFAPLKNLGDLKIIKKALLHRDRQVFENITGKKAPKRIFELSAEFLYPTQDLIDRWKGKTLPSDSYIS